MKVKAYLKTEVDMNNLRALKYFLGIEVVRSKMVLSSHNAGILWIFLKKLEE